MVRLRRSEPTAGREKRPTGAAGLWPVIALVLAFAHQPGCIIYAPFDLGLDRIGQVVEATVVDGPSSAKILLLRVDGEISDHPHEDGLLGPIPSTVAQVRHELELARKDDAIKGVLLRVNSPGGGVTASDLIHMELRRFRERQGVPVVALFLDTAASGGYYVAQAADRIVASPTTITGSIGVIAQFPDVSGLGEKIGVSVRTIASGARKDIGNPFRPMRPEEEALLRDLIDRMHERFVRVVADGRGARDGRRGMTLEEVRSAADGRVFTTQEAQRLGLIDDVGYFDDAYALVLRLAGLPADGARVVTYERRGLGSVQPTIYSRAAQAGGLKVSIDGQGGAGAALSRLADRVVPSTGGAMLKYLWVPGGA